MEIAIWADQPQSRTELKPPFEEGEEEEDDSVKAKMGGGMETNKNKFIEDWGSARENLEHNFRWTRRNFALIGIFGIALPIIVYKGIVKDFVSLNLSISISFSILFAFRILPS